MKIPCEVVVWQILPLIRRELARELVEKHGMKQAEVAKIFGVTNAAISQYLNGKRGGEYSNAPMYSRFIDEVGASARSVAADPSCYGPELCRMCEVVKHIGLLALIYKEQTGVYPPECCTDTNIGRE